MGIPILRGRNLVAGDSRGIVVSESLALRQWPGEDPVGQQFEGHTVVGIAGNARWVALQDPDAVEDYLAGANELTSLVAMVKTRPPEAIAAVGAAAAKAIDPEGLPGRPAAEDGVHKRASGTEISALAVTCWASARCCGCLGIVGLVAYSVSQRTKEIGIRMALGATGSHVLTVVLRQLHGRSSSGCSGMAGAAGLSKCCVVSSRRQQLDPLAYVAAIVCSWLRPR